MSPLFCSLVFILSCLLVDAASVDSALNITVPEERQAPAPCACAAGQCGCCTGMLLQQFNINLGQRGCVNITYDPDDFAFNMALSFNNRVLYTNSFSGKNPRPACVRAPRFPNARFCVKFYNVYFIDRNVHACIDARVTWNDFSVYEASLDCVRLGSGGFAVVKPEEGGGLPQGGWDGPDDEDVEDYEDEVDDDDDDDDDDE